MFYEKTILENGITVITEHMETVRSVALGMWLRVGNRDESPGQYGMSHFMEHMLFKGTPTRSALDISMAFDAQGAELNAFTSRECTCFYARMVDRHFPEAFEILSDMVCNASFSQENIDPEREVVLEEIARSEDTPSDCAYDLFAEALFPGHPLGRPVLGTSELVSSFETASMRAYHDAHYTTGNLVVVACGHVCHGEVVELARKWLSGLGQGARKVRRDEPVSGRKPLAVLTKDTEQAHIIYGMPSVTALDDSRFAYALLDAVLGGGMSSRLFQEIREKRGLVYSVYTSTQHFEDAGAFNMYAGTRPSNIEEVLSVASEQFELVRNTGIGKDEFERAKELACGSFVLGMESTRNHMSRLGRLACTGLPLISIDEAVQKYRDVTLEDVNQAAAELFSKEPTIAIVSPYTQEEIERML